MRGGPEYAACIKCAGRGGPARDMRALCGAGLNGTGRPALPPLYKTDQELQPIMSQGKLACHLFIYLKFLTFYL